MKPVVSLLLIVTLAVCGCKKAAESLLADAIMDAMTEGQWIITDFTIDGSSHTADFNGYSFQYHRDKTVDAIKDGTLQQTGHWDGSATNKTTWADFQGATMPLVSLNGTWKITNNTWTYVVATQANGASTKTFRLEKK